MLKEHGSIGAVTDIDVAGVAFDLANKRAVLAARIEAAPKPVQADIREHHHITQQLAAFYGQEPAVAALMAPTPLLGALATPFLPQIAAVLGGVTLFSVAAFTVDELRIHSLKAEARNFKSDNQALRADVSDRDDRLKTLRVQVTDENVQCQYEQVRSADLRAEQETRTRTAALKATKRISDASATVAPAHFDLSAALARLREPAGSPPIAAPARSASADDLAGGVPDPVIPDARAAGGIIAPGVSH
jgi:hypothetical protein